MYLKENLEYTLKICLIHVLLGNLSFEQIKPHKTTVMALWLHHVVHKLCQDVPVLLLVVTIIAQEQDFVFGQLVGGPAILAFW